MGKSKIKMQLSLWAEFNLTLVPKNEAKVGNDMLLRMPFLASTENCMALYWNLLGTYRVITWIFPAHSALNYLPTIILIGLKPTLIVINPQLLSGTYPVRGNILT